MLIFAVTVVVEYPNDKSRAIVSSSDVAVHVELLPEKSVKLAIELTLLPGSRSVIYCIIVLLLMGTIEIKLGFVLGKAHYRLWGNLESLNARMRIKLSMSISELW